MPLPLAPIAGNLRAFGKLGEGEIKNLAVGLANHLDDPLHDPTRPLDIVKPDKICTTDVVILVLPNKLCVFRLCGTRDRNNGITFSQAERAGDAVNRDHLGVHRKRVAKRSLLWRLSRVNRSSVGGGLVKPLVENPANLCERPLLYRRPLGMVPSMIEARKLKMRHTGQRQVFIASRAAN